MGTLIVFSIILSIAFYLKPFRSVKEGNVAVVTLFDRYQRVLKPGFN